MRELKAINFNVLELVLSSLNVFEKHLDVVLRDVM